MICDVSDAREKELINDGVDYEVWPKLPIPNLVKYISPATHKTLGALVRVPYEAISEIIVGFRADPRLKEWVKARANELEVPAYMAHPSNSYFRMEKVPLD